MRFDLFSHLGLINWNKNLELYKYKIRVSLLISPDFITVLTKINIIYVTGYSKTANFKVTQGIDKRHHIFIFKMYQLYPVTNAWKF
jgi:hypothetical protein